MYIDDTIAAIATPPGIGGIGIIRVSGKDTFVIVNSVFSGIKDVPLWERQNRTIQYGHIMDGEQIIDEVMLLLMKGPHSYTAEDVVEIQCHGGIVPVKRILTLLLLKGVRLAEGGEFTKRAFLNGRIDLIQAEAVMDIINAKTEMSLALAVNQLDGTLTKKIRELREELISLIAHMEVAIDYPEEDIEDINTDDARKRMIPIMRDMEDLLGTASSGRLVREGIVAAIIGEPNAGKSSLMNAFLRHNRAIVTDVPGTTRDSIEEYMNIEGIPLRLVDTAGIRETEDIVERIGVDKSKEYLDQADIVIVVIDGSKPLGEEEKKILQAVSGRPNLIFINKKDKGVVVQVEDIEKWGTFTTISYISAAVGEGLNILTKYVKELVYGGKVILGNEATLSNIRHIQLMEQAKVHLEQSLETIAMGLPIDCVVTDIRDAWELLGEISGDSIRENMTDELFKRFCLGK